MSYSDYTYAHSKSDVPDEHWAIVEFSQIFVPGDQRSRDAPGHGYPERYEDNVSYIVFKEKVAWEAEIKKRMESTYGNKNFIAVKANVAKVTTYIRVETEVK